jgi:hypothetical protein
MPTPPLTKRQQIVNALKLRVAAIRISNGYQTDIGVNGGSLDSPKEIDEWPTQYQDSELSEGTKIGLFDLVQSKPQERFDQKGVLSTMPCQVRLFHKRGTTPAELRVMFGDVEKAIITDPETGRSDPTLGGLVVHLLSDEVGFIVPNDSFQIDGAAIQFNVLFLTDPFSSYQ